MTKVGRATGLIRYDTEARMEGRQTHFMRPRTIIYSLMLLAILSGLVYSVRTRPLSDFQVLRGALDAPYKLLADGRVSNHMHIRIANKAEVMQRYTVAIESTGQGTGETVEVVTPIAPYPVEAGQIATMLVFFNFSSDALQKGKLKATVTLQSDKNYKGKSMITLLGPGK